MARAISADDEVKKKGPINFYGLQQPPHRPGLGTKGRHVMVRTNFFPIKIPQFMTVFHYDVTVTPQKLPKRFYRKVVTLFKVSSCLPLLFFLQVYEKFQQMYLGGVLGAYDGSKSSYYAREPIKETCKTFPPFQLALEEGDKPREFTVKLQVVGKLNIDLQRIEQILRDASESMPMIQALDVILRSLPSLRMTPVGRSFFSPPQRPTHLGGGKEVWSGHYQSVRPTMGWKLMLNVDVAATAFYSDQTVFDFLCSILRPGDSASPITDRDRQQFERELNDWERRRFNREIKGLRVVVTHLPYARKYRVLDLTRLSARKQMFPLADGTDCSVENYFKDTYPESVIDHPHLPCLHVGAKDRKVYLPIDVCRIVGGQKCMKKLSDIQTANMIKHTAAPAYRREASIKETVRKAQFNQDKIAKQFDIKVSSEMTEVPSRVLAPPKLNYRGGSSVTPKDGVGAWDMRNGNRFYRGIEVKKWAVVVCPHYCDCKQFIEGLVRQSKEMGMTMTPNPPIAYLGRESIEDVFRRAMESQKGLDLIVVIIDKGGSDYNQVKRLGDTTGGLGVATQCVLSNTVLRKCTPATLGNICLKINARLGGINSVIAPDTLPSIVRDMPIIIFGADVTHPRSEDTTSPSIAAVVASVDLAGSQYRALHNNQKHRQEIIANLKDMVKEHLREFKRRTQQKPVKIIFYRDGVSDGQFNAVILEEVGALQKACLELEHDYQPRITFIVVQKRHHTRFFPKSETEAVGRGKNVPPGTTVDTGITHPSQHDFYLCSHASIQGTSRPCHYHVLWDDSDFSADDLQLFTYQLCHMFWRCNRSVSYPAPTYYAHRDAAHARVLLQAYEDNSRYDFSEC